MYFPAYAVYFPAYAVYFPAYAVYFPVHFLRVRCQPFYFPPEPCHACQAMTAGTDSMSRNCLPLALGYPLFVELSQRIGPQRSNPFRHLLCVVNEGGPHATGDEEHVQPLATQPDVV